MISKEKQKKLIALEAKDTKHCTKCLKIKRLSEFSFRSTRRKFCAPRCLECTRETRMFKIYEMSLHDYDKILVKQGGGCGICGTTKTVKGQGRLQIDHSHDNGEVRGILCSDCNLALGHAKDDIKILAAAVQYLEAPSTIIFNNVICFETKKHATKKEIKKLEALEAEDTKFCTICKKIKPIFEFNMSANGRKNAGVYCIKCSRERARKNSLRYFGMSLDDYDKLLADQGGCCKICGIKKLIKGQCRLHVDHSKQTGRIRGIVCGGCNNVLKNVKDNPKILKAAIKYLNN